MRQKLNYYDKKIERIRDYFKHDKLFLELIMLNYESYNLYVRIDYIKKTSSYKLSWFDLDIVDDIEKYISSEYISELLIYEIKNLCLEHGSLNYEKILNMEEYVELFIDTETKKENQIKVKFNKYIPSELTYLSSIFIIIFSSLPKMLEEFLYELHALINDNINKYELKNSLKFKLETDDLASIFPTKIKEKGDKLLNKITFLEKINDKYYGVVKTDKNHLVLLEKINDNNYKTNCSCSSEHLCEHLYAVIKGIRENKFKPFYKIMFKMNDNNLLDKIMSFNYFLCIGTDGQNLEIVDNYGDIAKMPIFGFNGEVLWDIILDSDDKILEKAFKKK